MKFKASHNTMLRPHDEQDGCFLHSSFFFHFSLHPSVASDPPTAKQAFEVVKTLALPLSPQSVCVTGKEELERSNVTPT